jgi:hypothetical protein
VPQTKQSKLIRIDELVRDLQNLMISSAQFISPSLIDQVRLLLNRVQQLRSEQGEQFNSDLEAALVRLKEMIVESLKKPKEKVHADFPFCSIPLTSYDLKRADERESELKRFSKEPQSFSNRR